MPELAFVKWLNQASSPDRTCGIAVPHAYLKNTDQTLTMYYI